MGHLSWPSGPLFDCQVGLFWIDKNRGGLLAEKTMTIEADEIVTLVQRNHLLGLDSDGWNGSRSRRRRGCGQCGQREVLSKPCGQVQPVHEVTLSTADQ
jgi:hypothetical protein